MSPKRLQESTLADFVSLHKDSDTTTNYCPNFHNWKNTSDPLSVKKIIGQFSDKVSYEVHRIGNIGIM